MLLLGLGQHPTYLSGSVSHVAVRKGIPKVSHWEEGGKFFLQDGGQPGCLGRNHTVLRTSREMCTYPRRLYAIRIGRKCRHRFTNTAEDTTLHVWIVHSLNGGVCHFIISNLVMIHATSCISTVFLINDLPSDYWSVFFAHIFILLVIVYIDLCFALLWEFLDLLGSVCVLILYFSFYGFEFFYFVEGSLPLEQGSLTSTFNCSFSSSSAWSTYIVLRSHGACHIGYFSWSVFYF